MTRLLVTIGLLFSHGGLVACHGQSEASGDGGFREVLEIVGAGPEVLATLDFDNLTEAEWQVMVQVLSRLDQHRMELPRWTLREATISPSSVGELITVAGTLESAEELAPPDGLSKELAISKTYRCRIKSDSTTLTILSAHIPTGWDLSKPLSEPVALTGALLDAEPPVLLTTHLSWFPTSGLNSGRLLLARHGLDAALWEEVTQRTPFITPERGREAEAFYSVLAALKKLNAQELSQLVPEQIADTTAQENDEPIASAVAEQSQRGLSSVVPLFLQPEGHVGEVVRLEGTARRAVRIAVPQTDAAHLEEPLGEYFELEVFTADSQSYPVVCCVTRLPEGFPRGDAIRTGVRVEGVFFKLWRYRSREIVEGPGETASQKHSYTPIVLGSSVTWLQQAPVGQSMWGMLLGGFVFIMIMLGVARLFVSSRVERRRLPDVLPNQIER